MPKRSAKLSTVETEGVTDEENSGSDGELQGKWRSAKSRCTWHCATVGCLSCFGILALCILVLVLCLDQVAKTAIGIVGSAVLGVPVSVGSVSISVFSASSSISDLRAANPPGFQGDYFLHLEKGVFALQLASLLFDPLELQEITISGMHVEIEQLVNFDSNAKRIADRVAEVAKKHLPTPDLHQVWNDGLHAMTKKVKANKIEFKDITTSVCLHPLCDITQPAVFTIPHVRVLDVGKDTDGVYMYELMSIMLQAILVAAIKSSPVQVGPQLLQGLGTALGKALDLGELRMDVGTGLFQANVWTQEQITELQRASNMASDTLVHTIRDATRAFEGAIKSSFSNPDVPFSDSLEKALDKSTEVAGEAAEGFVERAGKKVGHEMADMAKEGTKKAFKNLGEFLSAALGDDSDSKQTE